MLRYARIAPFTLCCLALPAACQADLRVKALGYARQLLDQCGQERQRSHLLHQVRSRQQRGGRDCQAVAGNQLVACAGALA